MSIFDSKKIIDLTAPLNESTPVIKLPENFNQALPFSRTLISRYDERGEAFWYNISLSEHTGTHLDAPVHWESGKKGIDVASIPISHLLTPAAVIDMSHEVVKDSNFLLQREHIEAWIGLHGPLPENGWLLYRTGWDQYGNDAEKFLNQKNTPGISADCAKWLSEKTSLVGVGVETVGTDAGKAATFTPPFPMHYFFLGENKYGLTQLRNLDKLPANGFDIIISPLPITGGTGSPCRVFAVI